MLCELYEVKIQHYPQLDSKPFNETLRIQSKSGSLANVFAELATRMQTNNGTKVLVSMKPVRELEYVKVD